MNRKDSRTTPHERRFLSFGAPEPGLIKTHIKDKEKKNKKKN